MNESEILLYQTEDGQTKLEVSLAGETVWLSQAQMCELFQRDKSVISRHIRNIFDEGELDAGATVAKFATVQKEGDRSVSREVEYYNLDVVISSVCNQHRLKPQHGNLADLFCDNSEQDALGGPWPYRG